jgi:hypothetical protein
MTYLRLCMGAVLITGCGLIDSDVTNFDLTLPEKAFSVDAAGWQVDQTAADAFLMTDCSQSSSICASAATNACPMNCTGECSATTSTCELSLNVGVYRSVDLVMEKPELKSINDEPIIKVTINRVTYTVTSNTLNVTTPAMRVYVAPMSIMDPDDPMARHIGTIDPVPAGATVATRDMTYTSDGKQTLVDIMSTYKNPFNIIVGSKIVIGAGGQVPTGKLDAVVQIRAHAGL